MREPSLQDRIGVRAFFVAFPPNANDAVEAEKLGESRRNKKLCPMLDLGVRDENNSIT